MPSQEEMLADLTRMILAGDESAVRDPRLVERILASTGGDPAMGLRMLSQGLQRGRFLSSQAAAGVEPGPYGRVTQGLFEAMQALEGMGGRGGGGGGRGGFNPTIPQEGPTVTEAPTLAEPPLPRASLQTAGPQSTAEPAELQALRRALMAYDEAASAAAMRSSARLPVAGLGGASTAERAKATNIGEPGYTQGMAKGLGAITGREPEQFKTPYQSFLDSMNTPDRWVTLGPVDLGRNILSNWSVGARDYRDVVAAAGTASSAREVQTRAWFEAARTAAQQENKEIAAETANGSPLTEATAKRINEARANRAENIRNSIALFAEREQQANDAVTRADAARTKLAQETKQKLAVLREKMRPPAIEMPAKGLVDSYEDNMYKRLAVKLGMPRHDPTTGLPAWQVARSMFPDFGKAKEAYMDLSTGAVDIEQIKAFGAASAKTRWVPQRAATQQAGSGQ